MAWFRVVPAEGIAPPSPVCRTGILLLNEAGESGPRGICTPTGITHRFLRPARLLIPPWVRVLGGSGGNRTHTPRGATRLERVAFSVSPRNLDRGGPSTSSGLFRIVPALSEPRSGRGEASRSAH